MKQEIDTPSIDIREDYLLKKITPEAKEGKAKEKLQELFKFIKDMKFDAVVGNPPYQIDTDNNRDTPTYHFFMNEAYQLSDKVIFITPARFLFDAGQTPKAWNNKMLNDKHFKVLFYEKMSSNVFNNTDIKGGVAITYRDKSQEFGPIGVFSTFEELDSILTRVTAKDFVSLSEIHYGNSSYKLTDKVYSDFPELGERISLAERKTVGSNVFERFPELFYEEADNETEIQILCHLFCMMSAACY